MTLKKNVCEQLEVKEVVFGNRPKITTQKVMIETANALPISLLLFVHSNRNFGRADGDTTLVSYCYCEVLPQI